MGDKPSRMDSILSAVSDCKGVLALRIGNAPASKLGRMGICTVTTYDRIEDAVLKAAASQ